VKHALALPEVKLQESETSDEVISHYGVVTTGIYNTSSATTDVLQISSGPKGFVSNFAYEISKHRCYDRELDGLSAQVAY
jgi:catalase